MTDVPSLNVKSQPSIPTAAAQPPKPATAVAVSSLAQFDGQLSQVTGQ